MLQELPVLSCSIKDATRVSGLGRTKIYELINCGKLEVVKVGRRTLITMKSLQELFGGGANV